MPDTASPDRRPVLAGQVDAVVGVDTHTDSHSAGLVNPLGVVLAEVTVAATPNGYAALLGWARDQLLALAVGERLVWAVEGSRSHGAGLARLLLRSGEQVIEATRPVRAARRPGGKSDPKDAVHAARAALASTVTAQPRSDGPREALRMLLLVRASAVTARTDAINQLKALVLQAPDDLRGRLRRLPNAALLTACRCLRVPATADQRPLRTDPTRALDAAEDRARIASMRRLARRIQELGTGADDAEAEIRTLVRALAPQLLRKTGVGALTAAQIIVSWSHPGRVRSEAAFAALAGTSPLDASSGRQQRHRLNRYGDRALNQAIHLIAITRERCDPQTQAYIARRVVEGKTRREARRLVKRYLARHLFRALEHPPGTSRPPNPGDPATSTSQAA